MNNRGLVIIGLISLTFGCATTSKFNTDENGEKIYPPHHSYKELALKIDSVNGINKQELKDLKGLIIIALNKRGIAVIENKEKLELKVEILKLHKEGGASRIIKRLFTLIVPGPWSQTTANVIEIRISLRVGAKIKKLQEFKDSARNWKELKKSVANRIADAIYFSH